MKWTIPKECNGKMLREFLVEKLRFSQRLIKKVKSEKGNLLINGKSVTVRYQLQYGDLLEVKLPAEEISDSIIAEDLSLNIKYEDEYFIIIDKNAGMPTIPSRLYPTGTIANGLLHYYVKNKIPSTVHIVTRLDKDTSGLLLVAKHQYSHSLLSRMQRNNEIIRRYVAIVQGILKTPKGTIDAPIGRKPDSIIERVVTNDGQKAVTHYEVKQQLNQHSLVHIELETGRTHQIRVHFSSIGYPLAGDDLYGGKRDRMKRQALHCTELSFIHPFTKKIIRMYSDLPKDMNLFIYNHKRE